ncbi:Ubiquitin carboxyl-terminal hydrolase 19 [Stylosanthes scabra]|uniref:Ubiquitin carboxyl-terminal hydrolase 19 n=1 Tax=Stylosanthes scabra TaxID=79078 RepID=A0ABU6VXZ0_9FABA|nr:Ubiquitin carboxyl-terminal hydrolase 19 [Stylosanthes scabra]
MLLSSGGAAGGGGGGGLSWDLKWLLQWVFSTVVVAVGLHALVKNTASRYFEVHANFDSDRTHPMPSSPSASASAFAMDQPLCAVCSKDATKKCSRCKSVRYCSQACQQMHWKSEHKLKCKEVHSTMNLAQSGPPSPGFKASAVVNKSTSSISLVPACGREISKPIKQPKNPLFPYDEFVKFFNWDKPGFPPCGLFNCGNSCFANVVLQCLSFTRPLIAYLLENGHRRECRRNDWCFLCEFEIHVEKARQSSQAFSPMNILSRLPNIGGTLGYGRQEDAHEFMRFAIDTMQSVCLDEYGGEKAVPPNLQETTLIQHIFGGHLQSEVFCTKCEKKSDQYENMMDLTVEIHGDAASLEECLDQFTAKEWLHGENMYKCDGCKDYVKAWKRLTVKQAPNILTIALKRFQSGRFGKLNKRVTFPETLNLSPFMSEVDNGSDIYKLYGVVVHIDMLNASFFGHYICYIKDFHGDWYRIDDWKVTQVELAEVLSQGAYMLLYSRVTARPSGLQTTESSDTHMQTVEGEVEVEVEPSPTEQAECLSNMVTVTCNGACDVFPAEHCNSEPKVSACEQSKDTRLIDVANGTSCWAIESSHVPSQFGKDLGDMDMRRSNLCSSVPKEISGCTEEHDDTDMAKSSVSPRLSNGFSSQDDSSVSMDYQISGEDSEHVELVKCKSVTAQDCAIHGNGYANANKYAISGIGSFSTETSASEMHQLKRRLPFQGSETGQSNGVKKVEVSGDKLIM